MPVHALDEPQRSQLYYQGTEKGMPTAQVPGTMPQTDRHYLNSFQALHPPGTAEYAPDPKISLGNTAGRYTVSWGRRGEGGKIGGLEMLLKGARLVYHTPHSDSRYTPLSSLSQQRTGTTSSSYGAHTGPLPKLVHYPRNLCKETRYVESIRVGPKATSGHEAQGLL